MVSKSLIWYWHYRLKSRRTLNARSSRRNFEGVLLRDAEGGHACLHPWPELGDPSLQKCLEDLAGPRRWPIVRRALRCMEMDGAARSVEAGFTVAKLKCGLDLAADGAFLGRMAARFPALKWRLDFNESGDAGELAEWISAMPAETRSCIEFLEDPCEFSEAKWGELHRQTRVPLAVDREAAPNLANAQVMVIKPALDEPWLLAEAAMERGRRVVVTSYMDHPLGQAFAAWEGGRLALQFPGLVGVCGLQTHHLFEPDAFTEALGPWTPEFHPASGKGLGFDGLLEKLPWKRIP